MDKAIINEAAKTLRNDLLQVGIDLYKCYIDLKWGFNVIDKETNTMLVCTDGDGTDVYRKDGTLAAKKSCLIANEAFVKYSRTVYEQYVGRNNYCSGFSFVERNDKTYILFEFTLYSFKISDLGDLDFRLKYCPKARADHNYIDIIE